MSENISAADSVEARTRNAVESYARAWRNNDRALLLDTFAEDAVFIDPVGTPPHEGRTAIGKFWDSAHQGGAQLTPVVHRIVVCGNEAVLLFRMEVRSPGGGMALEVCDHMEVNEEGRIQIAKAFWDESCTVPLEE